jgi:hypothetical protein
MSFPKLIQKKCETFNKQNENKPLPFVMNGFTEYLKKLDKHMELAET